MWLVTGRRADDAVLHLAFRAGVGARRSRRSTRPRSPPGGTSHDAPRRWPIFRRGEFNAIVRDPDGNLLEAISDE